MLLNERTREHLKNTSPSWPNLIFVGGFMIIGFIVTPIYLAFAGLSLGPFIAAFFLYWATGVGITMGYHRYFAHPTFKTNKVIEGALLVLGAMSLQNTALSWSYAHRPP